MILESSNGEQHGSQETVRLTPMRVRLTLETCSKMHARILDILHVAEWLLLSDVQGLVARKFRKNYSLQALSSTVNEMITMGYLRKESDAIFITPAGRVFCGRIQRANAELLKVSSSPNVH